MDTNKQAEKKESAKTLKFKEKQRARAKSPDTLVAISRTLNKKKRIVKEQKDREARHALIAQGQGLKAKYAAIDAKYGKVEVAKAVDAMMEDLVTGDIAVHKEPIQTDIEDFVDNMPVGPGV